MTDNSSSNQKSVDHLRGYMEGYYGKLLSWSERCDLVKTLTSLQLNTYCYAPKEDPQHRLHWRTPHSPQWHECFAGFCQFASDRNVSTVAGIAPGLDFNFDSADFNQLQQKALGYLESGARDIMVLWDDIEADCTADLKGLSEGAAHAQIINRIADAIGQPVWTVPRVYAAEIENKNHYLEDFFSTLETPHKALICGNAIVATNVCQMDLKQLTQTSSDNLKHRTIVWDNFYANDYCPRNLFVGPWSGREEINDYMVNPTGMPYTDQLLLDIVATTHTSKDPCKDYLQVLQRHGVPEAFQLLAPYFSKPFFGDRPIEGDERDIDCRKPTAEIELAIEHCLWRWKSPLAREWYPFIFSLKHDLAMMQNTLPRDRILKTQTTVLAKKLLS